MRYQRIIAEGVDLSFRPTAKGYELTLAIHGDRLPPARQVLCRLLPQGEPRREAVAQALHRSQRTL